MARKAKNVSGNVASMANIPNLAEEFTRGFGLIEKGQRFDGRGVQRICHAILLACMTRGSEDGYDIHAVRAQHRVTFKGSIDADDKQSAREGFAAAVKATLGDMPKLKVKDEETNVTEERPDNANEIRTYKKHKAALARGWRLASIMQEHAETEKELADIWDNGNDIFTIPLSAFFDNLRNGANKALTFTILSAAKDGKTQACPLNDGSDYSVALSDGWRVTVIYTKPPRGTQGERRVIDTIECSVARLEEGSKTGRRILPRDASKSVLAFLNIAVDFDVNKPFSGNTEEVLNKIDKTIAYLQVCRNATVMRIALKAKEAADGEGDTEEKAA